MATAFEQIGSRSMSFVDGRITGRTAWWIYDATTPAIALTAPGLPVLMTTTFPDFPALTAIRRPVLELLENQNDTWEAIYEYENVGGLPGGIQPDEVGFVEFVTDIGRVNRDVWRKQADPPTIFAFFPVTGAVSDPSVIDIGGVPVDRNGHPVTYRRLVQGLVINENLNGNPPFATYRAAVDKRNSVTFYGSAIGFLVYAGAVATRIALNTYKVQHTFYWDEWKHMEQVPQLDQDGDVVLKVSSSAKVANEVYWRQPFPGFFDFNLLSSFF